MKKYLILFILFFATPLMCLSIQAHAEVMYDNIGPVKAEPLTGLDAADLMPVSKKSQKIENRESYIRSLVEKKYSDKEIQEMVKSRYSNSKDQEILKALREKYSSGKTLSKDEKVLRTDRLLALSFNSGKNQESMKASDQEVRRIIQMILQKERQLNLPSSINFPGNRIESTN